MSNAKKFKVKLSHLSARELQDLRSEIDTELAARSEKLAAIEEIKKLAAQKGLDLGDLLRDTNNTSGRRVLGPVAAKYADPADPSRTWTGRGKRPLWITEALSSGKTMKDLEIA